MDMLLNFSLVPPSMEVLKGEYGNPAMILFPQDYPRPVSAWACRHSAHLNWRESLADSLNKAAKLWASAHCFLVRWVVTLHWRKSQVASWVWASYFVWAFFSLRFSPLTCIFEKPRFLVCSISFTERLSVQFGNLKSWMRKTAMRVSCWVLPGQSHVTYAFLVFLSVFAFNFNIPMLLIFFNNDDFAVLVEGGEDDE